MACKLEDCYVRCATVWNSSVIMQKSSFVEGVRFCQWLHHHCQMYVYIHQHHCSSQQVSIHIEPLLQIFISAYTRNVCSEDVHTNAYFYDLAPSCCHLTEALTPISSVDFSSFAEPSEMQFESHYKGPLPTNMFRAGNI